MRRTIFRLIPFVVGLLVCVLCARLGVWQMHRAEYKQALQVQLDAAGVARAVTAGTELLEWQRVRLSGEWLSAQTVFLDNQMHAQTVGYQVLTPLRLAHDGGIVVIDRGWVAAGAHREVLPQVVTPDGPVEVAGLVRSPVLKGFRLDSGTESGAVWMRADPAHFAARLGVPVAPLIVYQESAGADGLLRDWPRPDLGVEMHKGYTLEWFSFSALALGLTIWFAWRAWRATVKKEQKSATN